MSLSSFGKLIAIAAVLAIGPAALAQAPTDAPEDGAAFQCSDGSKMVLSFTQPSAEPDDESSTEISRGIAALVWVHGANYRLDYLPPEPGPVQVAWSDGEHELTWSPGVHLMWMASDTHLMCGRSEHKH